VGGSSRATGGWLLKGYTTRATGGWLLKGYLKGYGEERVFGDVFTFLSCRDESADSCNTLHLTERKVAGLSGGKSRTEPDLTLGQHPPVWILSRKSAVWILNRNAVEWAQARGGIGVRERLAPLCAGLQKVSTEGRGRGEVT
jgi:hypothetical protein